MVSLSSAPGCKPDIVTQLVGKVGDVIGDWLSGAKSIPKKRRENSKKSPSGSAKMNRHAKVRSKGDRKVAQKNNGSETMVDHSDTVGTDVGSALHEEHARAGKRSASAEKPSTKHKKKRNYFGSSSRPRPSHNRSGESSKEGAIRDGSRNDEAGQRIFVCSGKWTVSALGWRIDSRQELINELYCRLGVQSQ